MFNGGAWHTSSYRSLLRPNWDPNLDAFLKDTIWPPVSLHCVQLGCLEDTCQWGLWIFMWREIHAKKHLGHLKLSLRSLENRCLWYNILSLKRCSVSYFKYNFIKFKEPGFYEGQILSILFQDHLYLPPIQVVFMASITFSDKQEVL